jgi:hypothetical protein
MYIADLYCYGKGGGEGVKKAANKFNDFSVFGHEMFYLTIFSTVNFNCKDRDWIAEI